MKATYKPMIQTVGYQQVPLNAGDFIFGRNKCAKETGLSVKQVRTSLQRLLSGQNVAIKTASKFSIVSIINWDDYQVIELEKGHQTEQQRASKGPASGHKQESKESKEDKEEKIMVARRRQIPPDFILSEKLIQFAKEHGINGNRIHDVFEHFKEHHQSRGTTMLDWDKAFMTWVRNDKKFGAKNNFEKKRPPADLLKWGSSDSTR